MTLAVAALLLGGAALIAATRAPSSAADPAIDTTEQQFLDLVNEYRGQNGLGALVLNQDLNEAADWYATDMATKNYFGSSSWCYQQFKLGAHCDSYGGMPQHRISAFGYGPASVGENSAAGFSTAQSVFNAWKGSPGHNTNMLRSYWKAIGIGLACRQGAQYGCYWVTDYGSIDAPPKPNLPYPGVLGVTPAATPLRSPTPTPQPATPTPTPAPPTPSPTPRGLTWGGLSCDGSIVPQDAMTLLMKDAGLTGSAPAGGGCPAIGEAVSVGGVQRQWGDIDCSGEINAVDSVKLLLWLIGIAVEPLHPDCPSLGLSF